VKIEKEQILKNIENKNYDISLHFSKRLAFELDKSTKAKSFYVLQTRSKSQKSILKILVAYHANKIY